MEAPIPSMFVDVTGFLRIARDMAIVNTLFIQLATE